MRSRAEPRRGARDGLGVVFGSRAQPVIDVHRVHIEAVVARQREQRQRIGATAAPDDDARVRREIVERGGEVHTRAASTRASHVAGSLNSAIVGRFSGPRHTASNAWRPPMS